MPPATTTDISSNMASKAPSTTSTFIASSYTHSVDTAPTAVTARLG